MPGLYDAGLRLDLLDALAARHTEDHDASGEELALRVWVARPGRPEQHDDDLRWWGSARQATSARALPLAGFHVVTRYGWLDLETGAARTWRRLRL